MKKKKDNVVKFPDKGILVNNEGILRACLQNNPSYKKYLELYNLNNEEQFVMDSLLTDNPNEHFFGIKYPEIEDAFIVFKEILPMLDSLYAEVKFGVEGAIEKLTQKLPPYRLVIKDLPEDKEPPSEKEIKEQLKEFLKLWIDMNVIDEFHFQKLLNIQ